MDHLQKLGAYLLQVPEFFPEPTLTEKGPLFSFLSVPDQGVTFEVYVVVGRAEDASQFLQDVGGGWDGEQVLELNLSLAGVTFCGVKNLEPRAVDHGAGAWVETYSAAVEGDLVAFQFAFLSAESFRENLRGLFLKMVENMLLRRSMELGRALNAPPARPPGRLRRWFNRS